MKGVWKIRFWELSVPFKKHNLILEKLKSKKMNGQNWAKRYHNKGLTIREEIVDTDFEIPPLPKPRDTYVIKAESKANKPGTWESSIVEVHRRNFATATIEPICKYERNYEILQTFEPFRQGNREYALISRNYTKTAVLDLATGEVIAEESLDDKPGFCPVGFYVPDWWDVNDGSKIPGSQYWTADDEWPNGDFGFVWGCYWGDDRSWKVQYLDLSQIKQGLIKREERFGYLELATNGFDNPCLKFDLLETTNSRPPHFIQLWKEFGVVKVTFAVEMEFNLLSGKADDWQRTGNTIME